ncbi:hypothetical protein [Paenibacillus ehimensis]|uniref:hypothetical protein n=1 Tax=Paenibacillus ehimensis TaxID=79264 RepID=UPI0004720C01|nr:hypothetical protein [Paenibacillus ehimensis]
MKVSGGGSSVLNLYALRDQEGKPGLRPGSMAGLKHDTVEISPTGRQLAEGAIKHHVGKVFVSAQIGESLNRLLEGKPQEVSDAVHTIIGSNLLPGGSVSDEGERAVLREAGLAQAKYVADHYMSGGEASELMAVMNQIAVIGAKGTVDPATGSVSYQMPPSRPIGAPEDYVDINELMKRFEPDTYKKLREAVAGGGDWGSILFSFVEKIPQNGQWVTKYREETGQLMQELKTTKLDNRFAGANTTDMASFLLDMNRKLDQAPLAKTDALMRNMANFARLFGHRV